MATLALGRGARAMPSALRNVLSALAIAAGGFALLNVAFLLFALLAKAFGLALGHVPTLAVLPVFLALVVALFWLAHRSRWPSTLKATLLTVPLATLFAGLGIALSGVPLAAWIASGVAFVALLALVVRTRQPWQYAYALCLVALAMGAMMALGVEI